MFIFQPTLYAQMLIKSLTLFTFQMEAQKNFFAKMGFKIDEEDQKSIAIQVGSSRLIFKKSLQDYLYHYCFLIPGNMLDSALDWMRQNGIQPLEWEDAIIHPHHAWKAKSVYFFDGDGNLAEFIIRKEMDNDRPGFFEQNAIINLNEIGMPTEDITAFNEMLSSTMGTRFWKGDYNRFGTHGDQEGMFLLPNPNIKKTWFPTEIQIKPCPFEAVIEHLSLDYRVTFRNSGLQISKM